MGRTDTQKGKEPYETREVGRHGILKRKSSDEVDDCYVKRPAVKKRQHLYLLLDDWERGYSIRKLDVDDGDGGDSNWPPKHFTEPPIARLEALHDTFNLNFVAHGTKIFGMQPGDASPAIPAYDTHTLALTICPWPSCHGNYASPFFVSVAGKLFLFMNFLAEYLGDPPPHGRSKTPWSWTTINARPPFYTSKIICYALHPDGRTLFVSAGFRQRSKYSKPRQEEGQGTFSFDAERLEWTRCGDWLLPFDGQAYFDVELESWVGLCGERDGNGFLCSCDVVPAAEFTSPPHWKLGIDRMFRKEPQLHLGVKLVYMGGDSEFCLVESLIHRDDEHLFRDVDRRAASGGAQYPRRRVLRLTTFGLRFNKNGELRTMLRARSCRMYNRCHEESWYPVDPSVFCL